MFNSVIILDSEKIGDEEFFLAKSLSSLRQTKQDYFAGSRNLITHAITYKEYDDIETAQFAYCEAIINSQTAKVLS